mgnify:CR=1 FL=1|jgi:antitoxin component of MazEF toxin-antitoxin module
MEKKSKKEQKFVDANGIEIPAKYVSKLDKERDRLVRKYAAKAVILSKKLEEYKYELLEECDKHYQNILEENNIKSAGKGNYTLTTFDKSYKIEISVQENISCDDTIVIAQAKLNEYLDLITKNTTDDLRQIVNSAFQTRKGQLDVKRIISLFRLNINHPLWKEAMELLKKSLSRNISKRYVKIWERQPDGSYKGITLNFSSL